jgi:hypothetical protein
MNTHSHHFPLTRLLAAVVAACALSLVLMAASASALTTSDLAITSTAPTGVKYGDKVAYTVTTTTSSTSPVVLSVDSGSSSVCKLTSGVVSVTGAGTCKIAADQVADATYDVGHVTQSFDISKAALTITASSSATFYGGITPSFTAYYAGFVPGDSASSLKTKPTCSSTGNLTSNPGVYPTTCTGAVTPNYTVTYAAGTFSISQAPLVLVPSAKSKVGKLPTKFTLAGFGWQAFDDEISNDLTGKPKCKVPAAAKKKAGTYKITCTAGSLKSLNYSFSFAPGILVVKKK